MYSVWAEAPAGEGRVREAMAALRDQFGGPPFEPHVTVLGATRLPLEAATQALRQLCLSLAPYTCGFQRIESGHDFFQCIYLLADPSPQVLEAGTEAKLAFGQETGNSGYMPHMSLVYGVLSEDDKVKAKSFLLEQWPDLETTQFEVKALSLYSTDPSDKQLTSWKKVAELPLEGHTTDDGGAYLSVVEELAIARSRTPGVSNGHRPHLTHPRSQDD